MVRGIGIILPGHLGLNNCDRLLLTCQLKLPDSVLQKLDNVSIADTFMQAPHMFQTNFWTMWETTFAFRVAASAQELRRTMHKQLTAFTQIEHLVGVNRTRTNQLAAIMLPLINTLCDLRCRIILNRRVTAFEFMHTAKPEAITVTG